MGLIVVRFLLELAQSVRDAIGPDIAFGFRLSAADLDNDGLKEEESLEALARKLVATHGSGSYELVPFPDARKRIDIGDYFGSSARIERELGWQPQVNLDAGLRQTLAYFGRFGEHYWP